MENVSKRKRDDISVAMTSIPYALNLDRVNEEIKALKMTIEMFEQLNR